MYSIVQDQTNSLMIPMLQCGFEDGDFSVIFQNCDDFEYTAFGTVCGPWLNLCLVHECGNNSAFNLDIGDYRIAIFQGGILVSVLKVRIYPPPLN